MGAVDRKFHFVVLAAQRKGVVNPLAQAAGVSHKCLMPLAGKPLIEHTVSAIAASEYCDKISVSIEDNDVLKNVPIIRALMDEGRLRIIPSKDNLYESVTAALSENQDFPAVITTADNVLLTPDMIEHFCSNAGDLDGAVALVRKEVLLAKYPEGQKRFHKFRDGEISNCNVYGIFTPHAIDIAQVFREGGQFVKYPERVLKAFGFVNLIGYRFALFKVADAIVRVGKRHGVNFAAVEMPFPEAPIDVDNERTARIAEEILIARQ